MKHIERSVYSWIVVCLLIVVYCCNPVKKVLNSNDKTKQVVDSWLANNPIKSDTTFKYLPGDTTTSLLVSYDTATIHDTVSNVIEKTITKTKTVTNTVHDTVKVTINSNLLVECQSALRDRNNALEVQKLAEQRQKLRADKWLLYFIIESIIFGACIALAIYLKLKP